MDDPLKQRSDITIVLVFFTALAIVGVVFGGFVVHDYAKARASAAWPAVEGVVLSRLEGDSARVRYAYSYQGRSYEARRVRVFTARFLKPAIKEFVPGETVRVYVNPKEPTFSVLQTGGAGLAFVLFSILAGACVFFGVGGVVWALSSTVPEEVAESLSATFQ